MKGKTIKLGEEKVATYFQVFEMSDSLLDRPEGALSVQDIISTKLPPYLTKTEPLFPQNCTRREHYNRRIVKVVE